MRTYALRNERQNMIDNPKIFRAARVLLGWSQEDLAEKTGLGRSTIIRLEMGETNARVVTFRTIQKALEEGGIKFLSATESEGEGIRYRDPET